MSANPGNGPTQDLFFQELTQKKVRPTLERTASGIMVPEGTLKRVVEGSQAKAKKRQIVQRPTRKQVRALGNTRVTCKTCTTPVKLKNFASHAQRLHPESDTAKKAAQDAGA